MPTPNGVPRVVRGLGVITRMSPPGTRTRSSNAGSCSTRARLRASTTGERRASPINDGALHIKFELPKKVSWDQQQLTQIAERIVASGEKVEAYIDVKLSVSETRYTNWPPALHQQFAAACTVDSGKPSFTLSLDSE